MTSDVTRTLGKTGVEVSRLGLGGHTFLPRYGGMDRAEREELRDIVAAAIEEGVNLFDVTYDEERKIFGALMEELGARHSVFLTCWMSKQLTQEAGDLKAEAERALSLLQIDQVDMLYLDWTCTPEQAEAMVELRDKGTTRFIGVLGADTALSCDVTAFDAVLVNHNYYLREKEADIRGIGQSDPHLGIISLESMGRGRFAVDGAPPGISMAAACLKYALSFEPAEAVLVAVRRLSHLRENVRIWKSGEELTDGERRALEAGQGYAVSKPE